MSEPPREPASPEPEPPGPRWLGGRLVLVALLAQLLAHAVWVASDHFPSGGDSVEHLLLVAQLVGDLELRAQQQPPPTAADTLDWVLQRRRHWTRSTAVHLLFAPLARSWPADDGQLLVLVWGSLTLVALTLASAALGSALGGARAGALAALLVLLAPGSWGSARGFGLDLPLAAALTALLAWLIRHPPWATLRRTFTAGLLLGLCCLLRPQAMLWAPGLLLPSLLASGLPWRQLPRRLVALGLGATAGSAWFWGGQLAEIIELARWHSVAADNPHNEMLGRWSAEALAFYPLALWRWGGWPIAALLPLAAIGAWRLPLGREARLALAYALIGLAIHQLIQTKYARYALPALPALLALLAAGAVRVGRVSRWLLPPTLLALLALEAGLSLGLLPRAGVEYDLAREPTRSNWRERIGELAQQLERYRRYRMLIGLRPPPPDWDPDAVSRLEALLLERFPASRVVRASVLRHRDDHLAYDRAEPWLTLIVQIEIGVAERYEDPEPPRGPPQKDVPYASYRLIERYVLTPEPSPKRGLPPHRLSVWVREPPIFGLPHEFWRGPTLR